MELQVNFTYTMDFLPARCTSKRQVLFAASTEISVEELPKSACKPAFRISAAPEGGDALEEALIVSFNDRLWIDSGMTSSEMSRRFARGGYVTGTPFDAARHTAGIRDGAVAYRQVRTAAEINRENNQPMREWNDDHGAAMAATLARRAADLRVFGGRVFKLTREPIWAKGDERLVVSMAGADLSDRFSGHGSPHTGSPNHTGRADRGDDAAKATGLPIRGSIKVLDQSRISYADDARMLNAFAVDCAQGIADHLHLLPASATDALLDIRDALYAARGSFGPALPDALRAGAALDPAAVAGWKPASAKASEAHAHFVASCAEAIARWEARPRDGYEWIESGLPVTRTRQDGIPVTEVLETETAGRLSREIGQDLSALEDMARSGEGRILMVGECERRRYQEPDPAAHLAAVGVSKEGNLLHAVCRSPDSTTVALSAAKSHMLSSKAVKRRHHENGLDGDATPEQTGFAR